MINFLRACRVLVGLFFILSVIQGTLAIVNGFGLFGTVLIVAGVMAYSAYAPVRRLVKQDGAHDSLPVVVLRRIAHRPRRTMTSEDYRHLREMEIELGFEPTDSPGLPEKPAAIAAEREADRAIHEMALAEARLESDYRAAKAESERASRLAGQDFASPFRRQVIASFGIPPARVRVIDTVEPPTDVLSDAADAAVHFAQLARVGRESCVSACRLCEARDKHYPTPEDRAGLAAKLAGFEDDASLRNWIEQGRWTS